MKTTTDAQLKIIHTLFTKVGVNDKADKIEIIQHFTEGRTTSSKEMHTQEAEILIKHLKSKDLDAKKGDAMRKKIISLAHEMHWHKPNDNKIDMNHINDWCTKYGYLHKPLNSYTYNELPRLVTQFENLHLDFMKKL